MMLLTLVACDGGSELPPPDTDDDGTSGTTDDGGDDTTAGSGNEWVYIPDVEAQHAGRVGVGVETGSAYFDNLKVVDRSSKRELFANDLEEAAPEGTESDSSFALVIDPLEAEEDEPNHALSCTSEAAKGAFFGDTVWNYYQYSVKVMPADELTVINLYFLVTDDQNYYVLSLNEGGDTADCYQVVNGEKTSVAAKVFSPVTVGEWTSVGITVERETVEVYIGGTHRFSLFNPDFAYSTSLSPKATIDAPYCASWESYDILNDGSWNDTTFLAASGGTAYGSWSMSGITETITFTWEEAITTDAVGMFFWRDKDSRQVWLDGGGICAPAAWSVQYLNDAGEYVDVAGATDSLVADDAMNVMWFDEITTTSLQFTLIKFTADEDATYGFSAYEQYIADGGDAEAEDAPADPSIRGMGLFEIEVYPAGTVAQPE